MRRRLAALTATTILVATALVGTATPAHAACPEANLTTMTIFFSNGGRAWATTRSIDCGNYQRLDWLNIDKTDAHVRYLYWSQEFGTPSVEYFSGGTTRVQAVNAYYYIDHGGWDLGNRICYEPCKFVFDGRGDLIPDSSYPDQTFRDAASLWSTH
jgi:hypothetical protein